MVSCLPAGRLVPPKPHAVSGVPAVLTLGHGRLVDVATDPDFALNHTIYLSFLHGDETTSTMRVMRASLDKERETLTD